MPRVVIPPFPPLPTQNMHSGLICVDQRLLTAYFGNFFAPSEPHLGNSEPGKLVKLFSLNDLFAIPTSFQHPTIKYEFIYGLIMKISIVALMWAFLFSWTAKWVTIYKYYYQKILETRSFVTQTKTSSIPELYPCMHQPTTSSVFGGEKSYTVKYLITLNGVFL